jgi:hypothetical protein
MAKGMSAYPRLGTLVLEGRLKTLLEVFFVQVSEGQLVYRLTTQDISHSAQDPNLQVECAIQSLGVSKADMKRTVISHSTSWRYLRPDSIMLTYLAYSDFFDFAGDCLRTPISDQRVSRYKGVSDAVAVLRHGIEHLAFLIKTDPGFACDKKFNDGTRASLENLVGEAAGRL